MYPNFNKIKFHTLKPEQAMEALATSADGLTDTEIKLRKKHFGTNEIKDRARIGPLKIFLRQFQNPIIYILVIAAAITLALQDFKDATFIFVAALINTVLGFYQESKAENALRALEKYLDNKVLVIRQGSEISISTKELVPGDIIKLKSGSKVPADCKIIYANDLLVDEAILTGESQAQEKSNKLDLVDAEIQDRSSILYAGSAVTQGFGTALVFAIGADTEIGKIADLVALKKEDKTPLQKALYKFSVKASYIILSLSFLIFFISKFAGSTFLEAFLIAVAVLVAAVPEGLPIVMTIILAVGVQRLAKKNGIVRKLSAAETLGSTTVILTDKTGTLTKAQMQLEEVHVLDGFSKINPKKAKSIILRMALYNTDASIENPSDDAQSWRINGKALEKSLVRESAQKYKTYLPDLKAMTSEVDFLPFNSHNKFSAKIYESKDEELNEHFKGKQPTLITVLGAPEIILEKSDLTLKRREEILSLVEKRAYEGGRIIALAGKSISKTNKKLKAFANLEKLKIFGLIIFKDPIKPSVREAMKEVSMAGVRTVIVTGDHTGTAVSIAKELGMEIKAENVLSGKAIDLLSDKELSQACANLKIASRISPKGKMRLTKAFQDNKEVVAMNGDGVNDAPAIKQADIGIAMGTGTDLAKQAADLVLLDDNFETIVEAIKEGHRIIQNIRKAIVYLSSTILDEIFVIGGTILLRVPVPFSPLQILWTNFFADSFPGISLAFEEKIDPINRRPNRISQSIFTPKMKFLVFVNGSISSVLILALYLVLLKSNLDFSLIRTITFAAFSSYSLLIILSLRSLRKSILHYNPVSNQSLNLSLVMGFALVALSIYLPFFQKLFGTVNLSPGWIFIVLAFGLLNILLIETTKLLFKKNY